MHNCLVVVFVIVAVVEAYAYKFISLSRYVFELNDNNKLRDQYVNYKFLILFKKEYIYIFEISVQWCKMFTLVNYMSFVCVNLYICMSYVLFLFLFFVFCLVFVFISDLLFFKNKQITNTKCVKCAVLRSTIKTVVTSKQKEITITIQLKYDETPGNVIATAEEMKRRIRWCMPKRGPQRTDVELKREWKNRGIQTDNSL
jgi:hypothetical protein